ncbi:LamG domain-containing protein [Halorubrum sp. SD626R]|uniref:LamG domain-containing protein n=1 Tax=Halorubrum sp. SD626R TaxID=1419722 RepID=UPI0010F78848|nr:LamG domain-containing protein [Halorubrum sp. SD626R]TKX79276.1 LamG domain-containing protein [Halorubrum sp. SD626R]
MSLQLGLTSQILGGRATAIPDSAILHYTFEEGSGSIAVDQTGNGNDGSITGTYDSNAKVGDYCISLDGTDDQIIYPDLGIFGGSQGFAISIWVNFDDLSSDSGVAFTWGEYDWRIWHVNGSLVWEMFDGSTEYSVTLTSSPSTGTWYHCVGDFDGSTMTGYLDSSSQGTDAATDPRSRTEQNAMGSRGNGDLFADARIDDPVICDDSLSQSEVDALYNRG